MQIAEVGDVIEYIFEDLSILATVGLVDMEQEDYGVFVTSQYSFRCASIAQDYVKFSDVIAIFKKSYGTEQEPSTKVWDCTYRKYITDWRNLC